jgi:hypothetical protein
LKGQLEAEFGGLDTQMLTAKYDAKRLAEKVPRLSCIKREKHKFERESKLPHKLRARLIKFSEIAEDALRYCKAKNQGHQFDTYRHGLLNEEFGNRNAEIPIEDLRGWFDQQDWEPGTYNRYKSTLSLTYRLAIENGKANSNPAKALKRKREDNGRVRFLNHYKPTVTEIDYLQPHTDAGSRLFAVMNKHYMNHAPELIIALHTGLRPSEQYGLTWDRVDLVP